MMSVVGLHVKDLIDVTYIPYINISCAKFKVDSQELIEQPLLLNLLFFMGPELDKLGSKIQGVTST